MLSQNEKSKLTGQDVSLYISCFNSEKYIGRCLESILRQSDPPGEIILIDDASTVPLETLPEMVRLRESTKIKIIFYRFEKNTGLAVGRNKALELCTKPLLASVDSDVVAEPGWLEKMLAAFKENNVAGVGGRLDEACRETLGDRWRAVHMAQHWGDNRIVNPRFLFGANTVFDAEILRKAGGYARELRSNYEDVSISDKIREMGFDLIYTPEAKALHLREDSEYSIIPGFWKWHHAKGLLRGDFNSPEGVISRIDSVNFGIYKYRFDMDLKAGRNELLILDVMIPWIFCALDLRMARKNAGIIIPDFPGKGLVGAMPEQGRTIFEKAVPPLSGFVTAYYPWHDDYSARFVECLIRHKYKDDREKASIPS